MLTGIIEEQVFEDVRPSKDPWLCTFGNNSFAFGCEGLTARYVWTDEERVDNLYLTILNYREDHELASRVDFTRLLGHLRMITL